jgi:hypothetical protein
MYSSGAIGDSDAHFLDERRDPTVKRPVGYAHDRIGASRRRLRSGDRCRNGEKKC